MKNQTIAKILNTAGIIFAVLALIAAAGIVISILFPVIVLIILTIGAFQIANYYQRKS
jgi:uncharacterized membrane protein